MLLRRMIEHVKAQNWTAIALDFLIVVSGVFIGIQVANWNDDRENRESAAVYSNRLAEDLQLEHWKLAQTTAYYSTVSQNAEMLLDALEGQLSLSDEELVISAFRASQYFWNSSYRTAYDELVATGSLGLIKDRTMREVAVEHYTANVLETIEEQGADAAYRNEFRRTITPHVHREAREKCGDKLVDYFMYDAIDTLLDYECALDLPAEEITRAAAALRENSELVPSLRWRIAELDNQIDNLETLTQALAPWKHEPVSAESTAATSAM